MLNRRDFLKLASALSASAAFRNIPGLVNALPPQQDKKPNILIFVFDAMSAGHLSLYNYPRNTAPNLENFAERSFVYHSHFSAGNFTTTGVASMLTGSYPWTHRALNYRGLVKRSLVGNNLFSLVGDEYTRIGFTQNLFAEVILSQFDDHLDIHLSPDSFSFDVRPLVQAQDFKSDRAIAHYAFEDFLGMNGGLNPTPGSLALGSAEILHDLVSKEPKASESYPAGYPNNHAFYYRDADVFRGMAGQIQALNDRQQPWFAYFHVWSPHGPYRPQREFTDLFDDKLRIPFRPPHRLSESKYSRERLLRYRLRYDQYIANVDAEFGNMMRELERAGILEDAYIIVTSDHGELFERGEWGHGTPLLYNAVTQVPLLISTPGQRIRKDIHTPTSSLDLLPTILKMVDKKIPDEAEGRLLPGFSETEQPTRSIYSLVAKNNSAFQRINEATVSMIKWPYELIYYYGYSKYPNSFELYNLAEDRYERNNLIEADPAVASKMQDELLDLLALVNGPLDDQ
jgi:arylsulfatase A-like enzyme